MSRLLAKLLGSGLAASFLASLCCLAPLLAVLGGAAGATTAFSWVEPFRPYLAGLTVAMLGLAWYQKLKPAKAAADCACEAEGKASFWQSMQLLLLVSGLALGLLALPNYAGLFYGKDKAQSAIAPPDFAQNVQLQVSGMTCAGCEAHVNKEIGSVPGVFTVQTSYDEGTAIVSYDSAKVTPADILQAASKTGYTVEIERKKR
ncbi:hypothetical protein BH24BAC1_BH24BAC1_32770 [soil metagenome]